ncbi:MAG: ABC transporter substrate-binding protein [Herminiimonas sp.]|nr:ABC transporter substrate-binding protein [Herminiimonas sp.]
MSRKKLSFAIGICLFTGNFQVSRAEGLPPVRIGEINSYSHAPAYAVPYRNGWQLALDEINAAGGVNGRLLEVLSRDDGGERKQAVLLAQNLILRDHVDILIGTYLSDIGLAVSNVASQNRKVFIAGSPLSDSLTLDKGNRYTFRLRPSTFMQAAMLVEEAARLPATRWATVAPNYEYGQSAVASFKQLLKARRPDVQFVAEQWPALGKLDAPAAIQALRKARPQAIFNAVFGADLGSFVREGQRQRLFDGVAVVSMLAGEPENLEAFETGAGRGWLVSGYPVEQMQTAEQARFIASYQARYHAAPRLGSLVGYMLMHTVAAAVKAAGASESEKLVAALRGLQLPTPVGTISFRAIDQQSTMGTWVGRLDYRDGHVQMRDWHYADGHAYLPPDVWVRTQRPGAAMR